MVYFINIFIGYVLKKQEPTEAEKDETPLEDIIEEEVFNFKTIRFICILYLYHIYKV